MARILVVYHRAPLGDWRSTYESHLRSLERYTQHKVLYLNTAREVPPHYLVSMAPDLVIFHYTFLAWRQTVADFEIHTERVAFTRTLRCPKAIVPHDEHFRSDLLARFVRDFGVTHVFTPAPLEEWARIYDGIDREAVAIHPVLTGYIDESVDRKVTKLAKRHHARSVDVGYRSWSTGPWLGRHGMLKREIGEVFKARNADSDLVMDISSEREDALFGDSWLNFLLDCRFTIGVEGGSSVFDRDGAIAERCREYLKAHGESPLEEVEAACFPGVDGQFKYFLLGPRHLEAAMTRTCQVLVEGEYNDVLDPGTHYISLSRDFSDLDDVLRAMRDDGLREATAERAYNDVVASGRYSYGVFAGRVVEEMLRGQPPELVSPMCRQDPRLIWNRVDERSWALRVRLWNRLRVQRARVTECLTVVRNAMLTTLRPVASRFLGEEQLRNLLARIRQR